jgi:hypothetical protein
MATKKTSTAQATAPRPTHRSVTGDRAAELGKKRVTFYLDDWAPDAMAECAEKAGDDSRNALVMRLLRAEAARLRVKVPSEEK